ncbi:hypothetical protein JOM56_008057 [Amanita muscaria]
MCSPHDWAPFDNGVQFQLANLLFRKIQMSAGDIDALSQLFAASHQGGECLPLFQNHQEMYKRIDSIPVGDVHWESFTLQYNGERPPENAPSWMVAEYKVWYRDPRFVVHSLLSNPDFKDGIDYAPYVHICANNFRVYHNFMSGDWAWKKAERLQTNPTATGAMIVPILLGSDKTTTSVATGDNEYYPLYMSIGNLHNNVRRAHRDSVVVIGFLAIAKSSVAFSSDSSFHTFRRQLLQSSLERILRSLKPGMSTPEVVRCPDGHYRQALYVIGPYMADYPEQATIASIVNGWCPKSKNLGGDVSGGRRSRNHTEYLVRLCELGELWVDYGLVGDVEPFTNSFPDADIHELIAADILHQVVKGVFKDHLIAWVEDYLVKRHGTRRAQQILDEIDFRISLAPLFTGLCRFPEGRGYKQWTGADSKALMKVYISAIEGYVPPKIVRSFRALIEFCYIVRREYITSEDLEQLRDALRRFHKNRTIFKTSGVRDNFHLPRQHALVHYITNIQAFGAPNGLCTSITECQHIRSVKEPWRRSNRNNPLGQMLVTNTRLSKLTAAWNDYRQRGMLDAAPIQDAKNGAELIGTDNQVSTCKAGLPPEDLDVTLILDGPTVRSHVQLAKTKVRSGTLDQLAQEVDQDLQQLVLQFLRQETKNPNVDVKDIDESIAVFNSAVAIIHAPSDPSGMHGMRREFIRTKRLWMRGPARYDCMFHTLKARPRGMRDMQVVRARLFFQFGYQGKQYPCALVHWFNTLDDAPDDDTGMWMVQPLIFDGSPSTSVVHIRNIVRAAHLLPIFSSDRLRGLTFNETLDSFSLFYVNRFIDHHGFNIVS